MTYFKKAATGSGLLFVMSIVGSLFSYFTIVYLARFLGPAEYGLFNAVFSFVLFFMFFRDLGLPQALTKYVSEFEAEKKYHHLKTAIAIVLSFEFLSSLLFSLFFLFSADYLALHYFKDPSAALILKALILYVIGSTFFGTFKDILLGFQKMVLFSLSELLKTGIVFIIIVFLIRRGLGVFAPVIAYAAVCFIISLFFLPFLLKRFHFFQYRFTDVHSIARNVFLFGIPVFATAFGSKIIAYLDVLMLTYLRSLAEVGVYTAILPTSSLFAHFFAGAIASVVFPLTVELWHKKDTKRLTEGLHLLYTYVFVAMIPPTFLLVTFSDAFIDLFFGGDYLSGTFAFRILLFGMLLSAMASINTNMISAMGKPVIVTKIILFSAAVNLLLNLIFIPLFGIAGAAGATAISYLISLVWSTRDLVQRLQMKFPLRNWVISFFLGLALLVFSFVLKDLLLLPLSLEVLIISLSGGIIYFLLCFLLRIIDVAELQRYAFSFSKKGGEKPIQKKGAEIYS